MSLISRIAAIATTAAAGGSDTFWYSSLRVTTSLQSGEAPSGFTCHAENESDGTIMQFFHSNALASASNFHEAFIIARDPVDGSIQTQKETSQNGTNHKFDRNGIPFYNPSEQIVFAGVDEWWDPLSGRDGRSASGYLPVDTSCATGETITYGSDRSTNGNGSFIVAYRSDKISTYAYNASTDTVPNPAGVERKTDNLSARGIWSERGSNDIYTSAFIAGGHRVMKSTVGATSLSDFSYVKELPAVTTSNIHNLFSNFEQCTDSTSMYLWCYNADPNPDEMQFFQMPKSNLSIYKQLRWRPKTGGFNGVAVQHRPFGSICCADGYVYFGSPIIYRGTGEGYNSVMYAIYQINPSTFQPVAAIGVRCDGGASENFDSSPGVITRNAEETCLYLSFSHAHVNSRGADSHKLLKLPLDFSSLPAQSLGGGSTHGTTQIWDFLSTSTGATLPVESELFDYAASLYSETNYNRTVTYEGQQQSNSAQESNRTGVNSSLISSLGSIST